LPVHLVSILVDRGANERRMKKKKKRLTQAHDELAVLARDVARHSMVQGLVVHPLVGPCDFLQCRGAELALQLFQEVNCVPIGILKLGHHFLGGGNKIRNGKDVRPSVQKEGKKK